MILHILDDKLSKQSTSDIFTTLTLTKRDTVYFFFDDFRDTLLRDFVSKSLPGITMACFLTTKECSRPKHY